MAWSAAQKARLAQKMREAWAKRKANSRTNRAKGAASIAPRSASKSQAEGAFRCQKCGRTFAMALHLGRHMTTHGVKKSQPQQSNTAAPTLADFTLDSTAALVALRRQIDTVLADRIVREAV